MNAHNATTPSINIVFVLLQTKKPLHFCKGFIKKAPPITRSCNWNSLIQNTIIRKLRS
jgi:hypothetical protein